MALAGLRHAVHTNIRPWISRGKVRFCTLDQLFYCVVASDFKLEDKQRGGQPQQRWQAGESPKGGNMQSNFRPSITEPAKNTSSNRNNSGTGYSKCGLSNKSM
jgi:hypothetical protein